MENGGDDVFINVDKKRKNLQSELECSGETELDSMKKLQVISLRRDKRSKVLKSIIKRVYEEQTMYYQECEDTNIYEDICEKTTKEIIDKVGTCHDPAMFEVF